MIGVGNNGAGGAVGSGQYIMTFNAVANPTDILTIRLFDSNEDEFNGLVPSMAGFYEKDTDAPFGYIDDIEPQDNVLCLDTNNEATLVNGQYVWATPDSQPGTTPGSSQVSFSGDYTIANISGSEGYTVTPVGKAECEDINIADDVDQFGNPIGPIASGLDVGDYGACGAAPTRWGYQDGFCNLAANGYGVLVSKSTDFALSEQYGITVQLAMSSDGGSTFTNVDADEAYWTTVPVIFETTSTAPGNIQCAADAAVASGAGLPTAITGDDSDGVSRILGAEFAYFPVVDPENNAFMIDLGAFSVVKAAFSAGDIIYARVTVTKFPCGEVAEEYICLGNIVDGCGTGPGAAYQCFYPYGVGADNTSFWTGIAITNTGTADGTATVTFYGTEGGMSTYTRAVAAHDIETFSMATIMGDPNMVGDLTGAENFQAIVNTDFPVDGIMFVGGRGTNTVLHGYLPRQPGVH
jgi:hypothetical protein